MKIAIGDKIILTSDPSNFMLCEEAVDKEGKKFLKAFAFYPNLPAAIRGCLKTKLRKSTATSLKELLAEHSAFVKYLKGLFEEELGYFFEVGEKMKAQKSDRGEVK